MKRPIRQHGIAVLMVVLLVLALATAGTIVAGAMSTSDVIDTRYQGASVAAAFAVETGLDRTMKTFAAGTTNCAALGTGTQAVGGNASFTVLTSLATDFNSAALLNPYSECRIVVSGSVAGTSVARLTHTMVNKNLLYGLNPSFNLPAGTGTTATSWTVSARGVDYTGGPDPTGSSPTSCSRAIYAVKARDANAGGNAGTLATATLPNIQIAQGESITVMYNYRAIEIDNGDAACNTTGASDLGTGTNVKIRVIVLDSATLPSASTLHSFNINTATHSLRPLTNRNLTSATSCVPTTQRFPGDYTTGCSHFYQAGTPTTKGSVTLTIAGPVGTTRTLVTAQIHIWLERAGNAREVWIDNVEFITPATGKLRITDWRDCAVLSCPST